MRLLISRLAAGVLGEAGAHLVTREAGERLRAGIEDALASAEVGTVVVLDFTGTGILDYSCADECLAKLVARLASGEQGDRYLAVAGLTESQRENLQVALERRRLAALLVGPEDSWECLGTVTPYLRQTLEFVMGRDGVSARELAGALGLELTAASTRLINLHRCRLAARRERPMPEGGREFVYSGVREPEGDGERGDDAV
jgi:hypothetical protein